MQEVVWIVNAGNICHFKHVGRAPPGLIFASNPPFASRAVVVQGPGDRNGHAGRTEPWGTGMGMLVIRGPGDET